MVLLASELNWAPGPCLPVCVTHFNCHHANPITLQGGLPWWAYHPYLPTIKEVHTYYIRDFWGRMFSDTFLIKFINPSSHQYHKVWTGKTLFAHRQTVQLPGSLKFEWSCQLSLVCIPGELPSSTAETSCRDLLAGAAETGCREVPWFPTLIPPTYIKNHHITI